MGEEEDKRTRGARGVVVYQRGLHYLLELDMTMETEHHCLFLSLFFALRSLGSSSSHFKSLFKRG